MPTPDEIQLKTFSVTLRGFDQTEVTRFLQDVAAQVESALERANALESGAVLEAAKRAAAELAAKAEAEALSTMAEAEGLLTMAETEAEAIIAKAKAEAAELKSFAERTREEAARIRTDALGLSERELQQAAQDGEQVRLKAVSEIESILARADAEVSSMLRAFRDGRGDLPNIGRHLTTTPRNTRRGSQRQLGP